MNIYLPAASSLRLRCRLFRVQSLLASTREMKRKNTTIATLVWVVVVCSRAFGATPIVWVVPSSLQRVGSTDAPGVKSNVVIRTARGEFQSFQVAIQAPSGGLTNVNFSVSKLSGPRGAVVSRANLTLYREWYLTVRHHSPSYSGPPNLPITNIDTFPDALIPFVDPATGKPPAKAEHRAVPFDLMAAHNSVIWVDVFVPRGTETGRYRGSYTITSDQGMFTGQIDVEVWGIYFAPRTLAQVPIQRGVAARKCAALPPNFSETGSCLTARCWQTKALKLVEMA